MMALATGIIVALLWLREPTTGVHSFGGASSIHQPVQFPVKLSQLLSYSGDEVSALTPRLTDDFVPAAALSQQHRDRTWTKVFGKIVVTFFLGRSATPWHAREIQL
jgi:hypothetical protein